MTVPCSFLLLLGEGKLHQLMYYRSKISSADQRFMGCELWITICEPQVVSSQTQDSRLNFEWCHWLGPARASTVMVLKQKVDS